MPKDIRKMINQTARGGLPRQETHMATDNYWFTHGGQEHKHRLFALDGERNKQLKRIADALEILAADALGEEPPEQADAQPEASPGLAHLEE